MFPSGGDKRSYVGGKRPGGQDAGVGEFGFALDPAGNVHRVAHHGELHFERVTGVADHGGAKVQPDAKVKGRVEGFLQPFVEVVNPPRDAGGGAGCIQTDLRRVGLVQPENRQKPIPDVFVDVPVVFEDGLANLAEKAVEHINDVVRQMRCGKTGEVAQVTKHDGKRPLLGRLGRWLRGKQGFGRLIFQHHAGDGHITQNPRLAGEAGVVGPAPLQGNLRFGTRTRREVFPALKHPYPAGRAARRATALVVMGQTGFVRDLQEGYALTRGNRRLLNLVPVADNGHGRLR